MSRAKRETRHRPSVPDHRASLHAIFVDDQDGLWTVGGAVLTADLNAGVIFHRGPDAGELAALTPDPTPTPS